MKGALKKSWVENLSGKCPEYYLITRGSAS